MSAAPVKLGIVGYGFVGKAVDYGFTKKVRKLIVDPLYTKFSLADLIQQDPSAAFISVPTPSLADGQVDDRILVAIVNTFVKQQSNILLIVKSTAPPSTFAALKANYPRLVYNPEFLTELNSSQDFINPAVHIMGGDPADLAYVEKLYKQHSICAPCPVYKTDIQTASLAKYAINTFLASKVVFFNQLKAIHTKTDTASRWEDFIKIVAADKRIGPSHMNVPGHDGRLGYGGSCFPKDTRAFVRYAAQIGARFELLEEVIAVNARYRAQAESGSIKQTKDSSPHCP